VLLRGGGELQPGDGAGADADVLAGQRLPLLDVVTLAHEQTVVAGADAGHADQGLDPLPLPERQRDVLRPERGDVEIARGQRGARIREALEHHLLDLDVVLGGVLGQQPQRRERGDVGIPCLTFTGAGSGLRTSLCAYAGAAPA
jgi:hypothetical protein